MKLRGVPSREPDQLSGQVLKVFSLTAAITPTQPRPRWRVHFPNGRWVWAAEIERAATKDEIRRAA